MFFILYFIFSQLFIFKSQVVFIANLSDKLFQLDRDHLGVYLQTARPSVFHRNKAHLQTDNKILWMHLSDLERSKNTLTGISSNWKPVITLPTPARVGSVSTTSHMVEDIFHSQMKTQKQLIALTCHMHKLYYTFFPCNNLVCTCCCTGKTHHQRKDCKRWHFK